MDKANTSRINPLGGALDGTTTVPGDKSISHRAVLFSAMAQGTSRLTACSILPMYVLQSLR